jgi:hypothetical protein
MATGGVRARVVRAAAPAYLLIPIGEQITTTWSKSNWELSRNPCTVFAPNQPAAGPS